VAAGERNDLLRLAMLDEREEEVEEVDVACDVDVERLGRGGLELFDSVGAINKETCVSSFWIVLRSLDVGLHHANVVKGAERIHIGSVGD
jgi:hypothetical protein